MNRKKIFSWLALALFCLGCFNTSASAQILSSNGSYALIFPKSGDGYSATILRVEKDSLVLFTNGITSVAKEDINKIILHKHNESSKGFAIGSLLGIYGMNYLLGTANGQPGAFLWSEIYGGRYTNNYYGSGTSISVVGIAFLGVLAGGGLGYLFDANHESETEITYIFGGTQEIMDEEWSKLKDAIDHSLRKSNWHLGISGAVVFPQNGNLTRTRLTDAGYTPGNSYTSGYDAYLDGYGSMQPSSDFNWLRSISLSYSADENLRIGARYALLGEPSFEYTKGNSPTDNITQSYIIGQRIDGKGYYATGGYSKSFGSNGDVEFTATAGIGIAVMSFDQNVQLTNDSSYSTTTSATDNVSIRKTSFSAMISADISYYLYDSMSLGLTASYYYAGTAIARAMPLVPLSEQTLNFGGADIGFIIGLHF